MKRNLWWPCSASMIASATVLPDESMTKVMFGTNHAAVATQVLDLDQRGAVNIEPLAPLDHHRPVLRQLLEPQVAQLGQVLHPVEVDVRELDAPWVDPDELKRGA